MAAHSSVLAWRIPWSEEPGGLQSMGLQRVTTQSHDWATEQHHHDRAQVPRARSGIAGATPQGFRGPAPSARPEVCTCAQRWPEQGHLRICQPGQVWSRQVRRLGRPHGLPLGQGLGHSSGPRGTKTSTEVRNHPRGVQPQSFPQKYLQNWKPH